jgi:hypothetical protein
MSNAPFLFEGRMIKWIPPADYSHRYHSYLFEIEKVYKGGERLQAGTVELIARMPNAPNEPPLLVFGNGWYLIFAKETDAPSMIDANNSLKLEIFYRNRFHTVSRFSAGDHYTSGMSLDFRTKEDLQNFLATSYGLSPTDMPKADTLKVLTPEDIEEMRKAKEIKQEIDTHRKTTEEGDSIMRELLRIRGIDWMDSIPQKKQMQKGGGSRGINDPNMFLKLDSIKYTSNASGRFVEFDIMGRTDTTGTYPDLMAFNIYYESDSLGQPFAYV